MFFSYVALLHQGTFTQVLFVKRASEYAGTSKNRKNLSEHHPVVYANYYSAGTLGMNYYNA